MPHRKLNDAGVWLTALFTTSAGLLSTLQMVQVVFGILASAAGFVLSCVMLVRTLRKMKRERA